MWWVYVARCADGTLYTGVAAHLRATAEHNEVDRRAARYTLGRRPVGLHAACRCSDRATATRLERRIKRLPRARKAALTDAGGWLSAVEALAIAATADGVAAPAVARRG